LFLEFFYPILFFNNIPALFLYVSSNFIFVVRAEREPLPAGARWPIRGPTAEPAKKGWDHESHCSFIAYTLFLPVSSEKCRRSALWARR
jgi:hypothetical protein